MKRDPRTATELQIHTAIVEMLSLKADRRLIYFHAANGEYRHPRVGAKLTRMGVVKGVPDLCFVLLNGSAAFMEIKGPRGSLSVEQTVFAGRCDVLGALYVVARSVDEAEAYLRSWGCLRERRAAA